MNGTLQFWSVFISVVCHYLTNKLTNYKEQSPSWKTNSHWDSEEILRPFMELEGSLLCSQEPTTGP
jgi:hypothetical protein